MQRQLVITAAVMVACVALGLAGCGGSPSSPSDQPQLIEGTISLPAYDGNLVNFTATRAGTLSASVDWVSAEIDVDIYLLNATCTYGQLLAESVGCAQADSVATDESYAKPAVFSTTVTPGVYTLVLDNWGPTVSVTYRLEIS